MRRDPLLVGLTVGIPISAGLWFAIILLVSKGPPVTTFETWALPAMFVFAVLALVWGVRE